MLLQQLCVRVNEPIAGLDVRIRLAEGNIYETAHTHTVTKLFPLAWKPEDWKPPAQQEHSSYDQLAQWSLEGLFISYVNSYVDLSSMTSCINNLHGPACVFTPLRCIRDQNISRIHCGF